MSAHFDLDAARRLANVADAVAIPHELARMIAARLTDACDEIERLRAERRLSAPKKGTV